MVTSGKGTGIVGYNVQAAVGDVFRRPGPIGDILHQGYAPFEVMVMFGSSDVSQSYSSRSFRALAHAAHYHIENWREQQSEQCDA
jgi:hypothetical protein